MFHCISTCNAVHEVDAYLGGRHAYQLSSFLSFPDPLPLPIHLPLSFPPYWSPLSPFSFSLLSFLPHVYNLNVYIHCGYLEAVLSDLNSPDCSFSCPSAHTLRLLDLFPSARCLSPGLLLAIFYVGLCTLPYSNDRYHMVFKLIWFISLHTNVYSRTIHIN